jgi:hypothetical protein
VKLAFGDAETVRWPAAALCELLEISRSNYYAWATRPEAPRVLDDAEAVAEIKAAHEVGRAPTGAQRRACAPEKRRNGRPSAYACVPDARAAARVTPNALAKTG